MNIANLTQEEKDKVNVDLMASGVAYKECLNMPVVASEVERQQPAHLRAYFNERLSFYRERSKKLPYSRKSRVMVTNSNYGEPIDNTRSKNRICIYNRSICSDEFNY